MKQDTIAELSLEDLKKVITKELSKFSDKSINTVYFLYHFFKRVDEKYGPSLLEHICLTYEEVTLSHEKDAVPVITREDVVVLSDCYDDIIEAKFKYLLNRKYDEKAFYEKLWFFIWKSDVFEDVDPDLLIETKEVTPEDKVRAYALYEIIRDKRIPYYCFPNGLTMSNDDFRKKCDELSEIKRKIRFILFSGIFDQKTEKASQLVSILNALESFEDKTIAMVFIVGELQKTQIDGDQLRQVLGLLQ